MKDAKGHGTNLRYDLPLNEIRQLYTQEKLSMKTIAAKYDVSRVVVVKRLELAGVSRRTPSQVQQLARQTNPEKWSNKHCRNSFNNQVMEKQCFQCGTSFIDRTKSHNKNYCSARCQREHWVRVKGKEYFKEINRRLTIKRSGRVRAQKQAMRKDVFFHLSNEILCKKCGFSDSRALQIDHIKGDGARECGQNRRKGVNGLGYQEKFWKHILFLSKEEARERYQILCANCNQIKRIENGEDHFPPENKPQMAKTVIGATAMNEK